MPAEDSVSWPGFCLASSMNSFTDLAGTLGLTTSITGTLPSMETGAKSFSSEYLAVSGVSVCAIEWAVMAPIRMV